jgi:hypothetical protein
MRILRALLGLIAIGGAAGSVLLLLTDSPGVALGTLWHSGAPESLNLAQAVIQRYIHPLLWSHVLLPVLLTPALVVLSIITVLALVLWVLLWRRRQSN